MSTYELEQQSFLTTNLDLKRLLKATTKQQKIAIDTLVKLCASEDHAVALKAARALVEFQIQVAKEINEDQLKRLIAELKVANNPKTLVPEDKKKRVTVDFNNLIEVT